MIFNLRRVFRNVEARPQRAFRNVGFSILGTHGISMRGLATDVPKTFPPFGTSALRWRTDWKSYHWCGASARHRVFRIIEAIGLWPHRCGEFRAMHHRPGGKPMISENTLRMDFHSADRNRTCWMSGHVMVGDAGMASPIRPPQPHFEPSPLSRRDGPALRSSFASDPSLESSGLGETEPTDTIVDRMDMQIG